MTTYGEYDIVNDEHYHNFISLVVGRHIEDSNENDNENVNRYRNRNSNSTSKSKSKRIDHGHYKEGILTVSNHRSLFDDPGVVSCLLPLHLGIQPKYNRW